MMRLFIRLAAALVIAALIGSAVSGIAALADDPYPAPPTPAFPAFSDDAASEGYVAPEGNSINVGGDIEWPLVPEPGAATTQDTAAAVPVAVSPNGLLFLWLGFLFALLVFVTSVIGSVLLFARRNEL